MTSRAVQYFQSTVTAPFGVVTVVVSDLGVRYVTFANDAHPKSFAGMNIVTGKSQPILDSVDEQLREYFAGTRRSFDVPLDLHGTEFQVEAWQSLARVPYGKTASYAQQAASIGRPKAVRAIGGANGRNPVAIVLPCHRIVGSDGSLTGFGGGIEVKKWLLTHEEQVIAGLR